MPPTDMARAISKILSEDPQLAFDFYCAASEIVDDFEDYGPALQTNEDGEYDDSTTIMRLKSARAAILANLAAASNSA